MALHVLYKEIGNKLRHDFPFEADANIRSVLNLAGIQIADREQQKCV